MANVSYAIRDLAVVADQVERQGHKILYLNIGDPRLSSTFLRHRT
jgi:hypothetical protein